MKKALDWIKENPISAASAVVGLVGIVVVAYFLVVAAAGLRNEVVTETEKIANELTQLSRETVSLPDPDPNNPPLEFGPFAITQDVIDRVADIYGEIGTQQSAIKGETEGLNKANHVARIFVPDSDQASRRVTATDTYRSSFLHVFTPADEPETGMPSFRAGPPPSGELAMAAMEQTVGDYLESVGATSANELTQAQAEELYALQQVTLLNLLAQRAEQLDLYADLPLEEQEQETPATPQSGGSPFGGSGGGSIFSGGSGGPGGTGGGGQFGSSSSNADEAYGPFQIAAWSSTETVPSLEQLWDGQVEIWIIRDLLSAIHKTNRVGETVQVTDADGTTREVFTNVITSPIKRLLSVEIIEGYVGLHTRGAGIAGEQPAALQPAAEAQVTGEFEPGLPGGSPTGLGTSPLGGANTPGEQQPDPVYPVPAVATLAPPAQPIEGNFFFGTTGRRSNSIYDVRHVRVVMHIAWDKLPTFYENLRETNFMTILDMQVRDIDEYAVLRQGGYVYGEDDVVEVEMTIETLWFRTWTTQYMPEIVKQRLVVTEAEDVIAE